MATQRLFVQRVFQSTSRPTLRSVNIWSVHGISCRHKSVMGRFIESIREQVKENKEFQQNVKLLQDRSQEIAESDAIIRAKKALERAKVSK
jgi:hypothetical protein